MSPIAMFTLEISSSGSLNRTARILLFFLLTVGNLVHAESTKPNIICILADDMGYSDLGCYGSEIPTPNLDALAANGLRFTQFYNSARCSPTGAALLTGLHPHQAGMGRLAEEAIGMATRQPDAYLGYLNDRCVTLAEALRPAGYRSYLAGKWHLGQRDESKWPLQRGFDRFYGILAGATSYLKPQGNRPLSLDNQILPPPAGADYYTTDAFTDFALKTIKENPDRTPFFLYLAFNAPHWPLHARQEDITKFVGKYRAGWDKLRAERYARQLKFGIANLASPLSERDAGARAWDSLTESQKTDLDYRMAVYAAQVHRMDWNIGRLVAMLRERRQLDNTLIFFLSDNGGCAEPYTDLGGMAQDKINDPNVTGNVSYGQGWANASNTPFRRFKSHLHEGGIATPLIVHWPAGLKTKPGALDATPGYLTDIMPTVLAVSGASYPKEFKGRPIPPLEGRSLLPILAAAPQPASPRVLFWEQYGFKAIRAGDLKAVFSPSTMYDKRGSGKWELYDLGKDRTERHDLAATRLDDLTNLVAQWDAWAARVQVSPAPSPRGSKEKAKPAERKWAYWTFPNLRSLQFGKYLLP
jgi:arylsulfatase A-like enzyme